MRLLLLWVGSLVTLHSFVLTHKTPLLKQLHIFLATHRVSKSHLKAGFSFHRYVHFSCVLLYILGFHHKPGASDQKDFTHVKFTTQLFSVQQRWWVLKGRNTSATVYIYILSLYVCYFLPNFYYTKWQHLKNYEKCFLFNLKRSFRSRDI